jgi:hypothetical protein
MLASASEILKTSWDLYKTNFRKLLPFITFLFIINFSIPYLDLALISYLPGVISGILVILIIPIINALLSIWVTNGFILTASALSLSQPAPEWKLALSQAKAYLPRVVGASILVALIVIGGTIAFIIPGIIFTVWLMFVSQEIVLKNAHITEALSASKALVSGRWWKMWWRFFFPNLVFGLVLFVAVIGLGLLLSSAFSADSLIGGVATDIFVNAGIAIYLPLPILVTTILFHNAKDNPMPVVSAPVVPPKMA